ncbi:hypothetical protein TSAR_007802 [Trichomalopsis sarcophagae]|uniref:Uncharacterized protein n=1 Tax=Trichomalopsis sarcophagae TaxID=543379 RepID=A0A232EQF9_9HYME|nr:hypothetical protein TSAR_007802 [Trichomalopsis sarcophagae]
MRAQLTCTCGSSKSQWVERSVAGEKRDENTGGVRSAAAAVAGLLSRGKLSICHRAWREATPCLPQPSPRTIGRKVLGERDDGAGAREKARKQKAPGVYSWLTRISKALVEIVTIPVSKWPISSGPFPSDSVEIKSRIRRKIFVVSTLKPE